MRIDLRKLYSLASVDVDGTITFPEERLKSAGIIRLEDVSVHGKAIINYEDEIELDLDLSGKMYLPCAISLEEVEVPFATKIEEIIGENNINNNFNTIYGIDSIFDKFSGSVIVPMFEWKLLENNSAFLDFKN